MRWRIWRRLIWLAILSRDDRRRLARIVWRHSPALLLETWRAFVTAVVLVIMLGGWIFFIAVRFPGL
jgi:hypothetical protein